MSKKLDTSGIANELTEGSAFFRSGRAGAETGTPSPTAKTPDDPGAAVPERSLAQTPTDRATARPPDEATARPGGNTNAGRGELIRRGFEWYADQLRSLKKLSLEEQLDGKPGSMSAMVREALDDYLKKRAVEK